jgi:hypothetical protein
MGSASACETRWPLVPCRALLVLIKTAIDLRAQDGFNFAYAPVWL